MKITIAKQIRILSFHLYVTLIMLGILWWLKFEYSLVMVFLIVWLLYTLPAIYLHVEYYVQNRSLRYKVLNDQLIVWIKNVQKTYRSSDLKTIAIYLAPNKYKGDFFRYLPIESYYFARITTSTGEEIVITCLVDPDLKQSLQTFKNVNAYRVPRLFCNLSSR
jgi:hypothetical protein